ncbi:MAG TPA: 50S ribosomal protein L21 [Alphaproteobacteria bacterium]|jgi:large subunit ribosomal protein L21|nr:50S ribosomal protein L21 [Alphaproteobacteria bacterium]
MEKYAIVRIGGKQYKAQEGKELLVDKIVDLTKIDPEVLLFTDGKEVKVGTPVLSDIKVKLKVVTEVEKGEKLEIYKFKSKSRYRKHTGFRPQYTRLLVEKIA